MTVQLETPPCKAFNCENQQACKNQFIACRGFADFVRFGGDVFNEPDFQDRMMEPNRNIYLRMFPMDREHLKA